MWIWHSHDTGRRAEGSSARLSIYDRASISPNAVAFQTKEHLAWQMLEGAYAAGVSVGLQCQDAVSVHDAKPRAIGEGRPQFGLRLLVG